MIGTVEGDLHDIGKNLVGMLLQGAGFTVVNLGTGVTAADFVAAVQGARAADRRHERPADHHPAAHERRRSRQLKDEGLRDSVKVMVGGAPVTAAFADEIGADGYGANAGMAVERAKELVG